MHVERQKPLLCHTFKGKRIARQRTHTCSSESVSRIPYPSRNTAKSAIEVAKSAVVQGLPGTIEACDERQRDRRPAMYRRNPYRTSFSIKSTSNSTRKQPKVLAIAGDRKKRQSPASKIGVRGSKCYQKAFCCRCNSQYVGFQELSCEHFVRVRADFGRRSPAGMFGHQNPLRVYTRFVR